MKMNLIDNPNGTSLESFEENDAEARDPSN
jgi:hypothetical protein